MNNFKNYLIYSALVLLLLACSDNISEDSIDTTDDISQGADIPNEDKLAEFFIDTEGLTIVDEPKIPAKLILLEKGEEVYNGRIGIEIRGKSSQMFPKKQYGFETWDANNEDMDASLLGYPEEEDWILYAPYSDKALVRNMLIYDLSNDIGRYASRTTLANVFINETYNGLYIFMEKLKRDSGRININNLKEDENSGEDLSGGYILKLDKSDIGNGTIYNDENSFKSNYDPPNFAGFQDINFIFDDPDPEDITTEQKNYIINYIKDFEDALASNDFTDPVVGYDNYIDVESFIDFFLLNELANNVDGFRLSTWMTKDKNEKLKMGPIWDFNLAFGNANYCGGGATDVWAYKFNERCSDDTWLIPFWWDRLMEDPNFTDRLKARWLALRSNEFSRTFIFDKIDDYLEKMEKSNSIDTNFQRWPVLGTYVWPNNFIGQTHESEIEYLKTWIDNRLTWLDGAISGL